MAAGATVGVLPQRLRNFFARYPPQFYSAAAIPKRAPPQPAVTETETTSTPPSEPEPSSTPAEPVATTTTSSSPSNAPPPIPSPNKTISKTKATETANSKSKNVDPTAWTPSKAILRSNKGYPNPFLPFFNPETQRWRGAVVSLRRQAELVKMARKYGVEELLPPGKKSAEYKEARSKEVALKIKGTGPKKVKGHKWERTLATRLEERRKAMLEMPALIRLWKQRGHGRGWKKYPRK